MKKVKIYIALFLGGMMLVNLAACSDDDKLTPSPVVDPNCINASFAGRNIDFLELEDTDPTSMTLTVTRDKTDAAATVAIEVLSNTEDVFSIPANVSFAAGQATATLGISFDNAQFKKEYSFEIALEESAVNPYKGNGFASFTVQRFKWVDVPGTCTFKDWVFAEYNDVDEYEVSIQQIEDENRYRIVDPFKEGLEALGEDPDEADPYLYFNISSSNQVNFTSYNTAYDGGIVGYSTEDYMGVGDVDSKYNPDTQTVTFSVYYYGDEYLGQKESQLILPTGFELVEE